MMLVTADQLVAHAIGAIGDYVLQSDWMATEKTKKSVAPLVPVLTYSIPFLFLTTSWKALAVIVGTHFVIDRWRLARYVCCVKNFLQPKTIEIEKARAIPPPPRYENLVGSFAEHGRTVKVRVRNHLWSECSGVGHYKDRPAWVVVWLLVIADNTLHVLINALALKYLG